MARRHRDKLFAYIDASRYEKFLESFHVNVSTDLPCFLVWNGGNGIGGWGGFDIIMDDDDVGLFSLSEHM